MALGFLGGSQGLQKYVEDTKLLGGKLGEDTRGALYGLTIYFRFITWELYSSPLFGSLTKGGILFLNVYYFFIRRQCLQPCLQNLAATFSSKTQTFGFGRVRKQIEILCVLMVASCAVMPGGHMQFQLWYVDWVPLLLFMTGLHPVFLF